MYLSPPPFPAHLCSLFGIDQSTRKVLDKINYPTLRCLWSSSRYIKAFHMVSLTLWKDSRVGGNGGRWESRGNLITFLANIHICLGRPISHIWSAVALQIKSILNRLSLHSILSCGFFNYSWLNNRWGLLLI